MRVGVNKARPLLLEGWAEGGWCAVLILQPIGYRSLAWHERMHVRSPSHCIFVMMQAAILIPALLFV